MDRRRLLSTGGVLLTGVLAGCSGIPFLSKPVSEARLSVVRVRAPDDDGDMVRLPVVLELSNPTESELPSPSGELTATIDGTELTDATVEFDTVPPDGSAEAEVVFSEAFDRMSREMGARMYRGKFSLGLTGTIRADGGKTSVDLTHDYQEREENNGTTTTST